MKGRSIGDPPGLLEISICSKLHRFSVESGVSHRVHSHTMLETFDKL